MIRIYERLVVAALNAADAPKKVAKGALRAACILCAYVGPERALMVPDESKTDGSPRPRTPKECRALAIEDGDALATAIWGDER